MWEGCSMIPFIRSITELIAITESRSKDSKNHQYNDVNNLTEDSGQRKRYIRSNNEKKVSLPVLPNTNRRKLIKGKEVLTKFFDSLDYNNQIQSSYDLTLIERQNNYDQHDVA